MTCIDASGVGGSELQSDALRSPPMLDAIFREMDEKTPATGFNVVCIDDFEPPGSRLTVCSHVKTVEEAIALLRQLRAESPLGEFAIYPAKGESCPFDP